MVLCIMSPTGKEDLLPNLCGMFREECGPPVFSFTDLRSPPLGIELPGFA
jgi:hypothetical protein